MTLHNLGENGFSGPGTDLFGDPIRFHPQFTHKKQTGSVGYTPLGEMGETGEFTRHRVGEMGERPIGLTHSPMPAQQPETVALAKQSIVSDMNQSAVIDFARRLRSRFGQGVRLTYHATPEQTQGRQPYWWDEVTP